MTAEQEFGRAREVLMRLVKIHEQRTGAKQLLGIVQQNLARLQPAEQLRRLEASEGMQCFVDQGVDKENHHTL